MEPTDMLHTSDLLYLYPPNDMTVLMLGFYGTPVFFFASMPFFVYHSCVDNMLYDLKLVITIEDSSQKKKRRKIGGVPLQVGV